METFIPTNQWVYSLRRFLSYLWGMETSHGRKDEQRTKSSYPTYEEWKLFVKNHPISLSFPFLSYLWGMETLLNFADMMEVESVLILPMRNGNHEISINILDKYGWFLSYLWGMETIMGNIYPLFLHVVLILPMRNGNFNLLVGNIGDESPVLILPMRNGNPRKTTSKFR